MIDLLFQQSAQVTSYMISTMLILCSNICQLCGDIVLNTVHLATTTDSFTEAVFYRVSSILYSLCSTFRSIFMKFKMIFVKNDSADLMKVVLIIIVTKNACCFIILFSL